MPGTDLEKWSLCDFRVAVPSETCVALGKRRGALGLWIRVPAERMRDCALMGAGAVVGYWPVWSPDPEITAPRASPRMGLRGQVRALAAGANDARSGRHGTCRTGCEGEGSVRFRM